MARQMFRLKRQEFQCGSQLPLKETTSCKQTNALEDVAACRFGLMEHEKALSRELYPI
jgi:hypothetical protein